MQYSNERQAEIKMLSFEESLSIKNETAWWDIANQSTKGTHSIALEDRSVILSTEGNFVWLEPRSNLLFTVKM